MAPAQRVALVMCGSFNPITNMHLRMFELARDALRNSGFDPVIGFISPVSDGYKKRDLASSEHRCNIIRAALQPQGWIFLDTWECSQTNWMPTRDVLEYFQKKMDNWYEQFSQLVEGNEQQQQQQEVVIDAKRARLDPKVTALAFSNRESASNFPMRQQRGLAAMYEEDYRRRSPSPPPMRQAPKRQLSLQVGNSKEESNAGIHVMFLCGADLFESFAAPGLWADEDVLTIAGRFGIVCINRYGTNADRFIYESDLLNDNRHNIFIVTDWIVNEISSTKVRRALRRGESVRYLLQESVIDYIYKHNLYGATPPLGDRNAPHDFSKYFPMLSSSANTPRGSTPNSPISNNNSAIAEEDKQQINNSKVVTSSS